jgi:hypothetical protein
VLGISSCCVSCPKIDKDPPDSHPDMKPCCFVRVENQLQALILPSGFMPSVLSQPCPRPSRLKSKRGKEDIADPPGRFDIPSGRTNKPDPEITKALKGRWIAVDRNTLSPELQALVNDAKVDGILENRTQRREKALAELQQGKKDRIAAEAGSKA